MMDVERDFNNDDKITFCAWFLVVLVLVGGTTDHFFRKKCSLGSKWTYSQLKCVKYEKDCNPERNVFKQYIYDDELRKCVSRCEPKERHEFNYKYYWNNGECHLLLSNSSWKNKSKFTQEEKTVQEEFLKSGLAF
ncbi:MAG: hypothetical protein LCH20_01645 [Proteobacteria bacterium]|nr:hypothetical protein [Pseudomonadota bacterium]